MIEIKKSLKGEKRYDFLRKEYPLFVYQDFDWTIKGQQIHLQFHYVCGDVRFAPKSSIKFPKAIDVAKLSKSRKKLIDNLVFNIGMIEMVSYWKATCSPFIQVDCGTLSKPQIKWWKKLYYHGLGEFFYLNGLDVDIESMVDIVCAKGLKYERNDRFKPKENRLLVPIGGGKDSLASVSLLSPTKDDKFYLLMNPTQAAKDSAKSASGSSAQSIVLIKRVIDKNLLVLNAKGYLNGHTPFSAMLAFYSTLVSVYLNTKYACLSNEASANEPTIIGTDINHQYSKTVEFEQNYNSYLKKYISPNYTYMSLLRPLNEFQIVKIFSQRKNNLKIFKSCNVGSKKDIWCCDCSKCLFVYILLSAHIGLKATKEVFGDTLLNKKALKKEFLELIGHADTKPFECIGTIDEIRVAITLIKEQEPSLFAKQSLLKLFEKKYSNSFASKKEITTIQDTFFKGHKLNKRFKKLVYEGYRATSS